MKSEKEKFTLKKKSIEDEFKTEYRKVQQLLNTTVHLAISFENDKDFMLAFQNEFSEAPKIPDVSKYWIGLYSKQKVDEVFLIQKGILEKEKTTLTETKLLEKRKEFFELVTKNKAPKECYTHNIEETNIYKQFRIIEDILKRFKEMKGFDSSADSLLQQAEEFGKGLISEIENINYEPIRTKVIEIIVADKDNEYSYFKSHVNINFNKKEFDDNYAKTKMYLNNYLRKYLETQVSTIKENIQSNSIEKKTTKKETYLFDIGLKLALGELDEDLIIKEGNISLNADLSFPKLANKYQLNEQYLKCTINNYNDISNRSKNLRNSSIIIQKVITHLKSIDKEPKEWFLKEFEI